MGFSRYDLRNQPTSPIPRMKSEKEEDEKERQRQAAEAAEAAAKEKAEAEAKAEAERQKQAEAATPYEGPPMRDPVTTLPDATYGESLARKALSPESYPKPEPEPEPAQPTGPVSLAGGLAVGSGAPNVDMGKLAKSRGGLPYSFEETKQDPVTVKFPMTQAQFDALSTREQMQAEQKLSQMGADRSKMILPTQADVNLYQSRWERDQATNPDTFGLEGGAPEPTFEIEADPRNYVDPRRPNEGRWIDPQTGDEYNVTEAYGRQLRQRMPQLVRPEVMDRMMGMGMAPEFMKSKGDEGPDLDKFQKFRERLDKQKQVEEFPPAEGFDRDKALAEANERAAEQTRGQQRDAGQTVEREGQRDLPGKVKREEPYFGRSSDPENRPSSEEIAAAYGDREGLPLRRGGNVEGELTDADAFPPEAYGPNYSGMFSEAAVEDLPDAMDVSSDFNRPEAQGAVPEVDVPDAAEVYEDPLLGEEAAVPPPPVPRAEEDAPEVDIPIDDDDEPDKGFDVEMDPEDVSSFREAVEAALAQPRVTPELSDADLGPFIEAIFGAGTKATEEIIAEVREILGQEAYRGMTPAQVRAEVRRRNQEFRDPLQ